MGRKTMLKISPANYELMRRHGEKTYPDECCGVLLGKAAEDLREVLVVVEAGNSRTDSAHNRYNILPAELIKIQRMAREQGHDIVGFYHSHPDHPARWSATDFAEAHWIGCSYVITSVAGGRADRTAAFALNGATEEDKRFDDEEIRVEG